MIPIKDRDSVKEYGELIKTFYVYLEESEDKILFEVWKVGEGYHCYPKPTPKLYGHLNSRQTIEEAEDYALSSYRMWLISNKKD